MGDKLFYTDEDMDERGREKYAAGKTQGYKEGWNDALDYVRETNGEGSRAYL